MAMSDCPDCWSTPCVCGSDYKNYRIKQAANLIAAVLKYRSEEDKKEILKMAVENPDGFDYPWN